MAIQGGMTVAACGRVSRFFVAALAAVAAVAAMLTVSAVRAQAAPAVPAGQAAALADAGSGRVGTTIAVTTLNNSGSGSLRAAITAANQAGAGTTSTITFGIDGVINLKGALPVLRAEMVVNGETAPGYAGKPLVEVNFNGHPGLVFGSGSAGSELLGLAVGDASGPGLALRAGSITVNKDYVGLGLRGARLGDHGPGIYVSGSSARNVIGKNPSGVSGTVANVVSANRGAGIVVSGSSGNVIEANRIGTNRSGSVAFGNSGPGLVLKNSADHNEIGGTEFVDRGTGKANNPTGSKGTVTPVFVVPPLGNQISGNGSDGVLIENRSAGNTLNGNFIGTTANGDHRLANHRNGVTISGSSGNALIGCRFVNNPFVYYNVISGNDGNGLRILDSDGTVVQGNFFGITANNSGALSNTRNGILVTGTSANTQVGGVIPLGNVAAGNGLNGIAVTGRARTFITFNTFGGLLAFKGAAPNGRNGLLITASGGGDSVRTNVFSGNRHNGIELAGDAHGVTVDPDIAGLTTNGRSRLANGGDGLLITGHAHQNVIGGSRPSVIPQNTFSGNDKFGIAITGNAWGNHVFGAFIGTAIFGVTAIGNRSGGVMLGGTAHANLIGYFRHRSGNIISGNIGDGVLMHCDTYRNHVVRNRIGVARRARRLPNAGHAVVNYGKHNVVRFNRVR